MRKKTFIGILFCIFILMTILMLTKKVNGIDDAIYSGLMTIRNDGVDILWKGITQFANMIPVFCITVLLLIVLPKKDRYFLGITVITTTLVNQIFKYIIQRPRPNHIRLIKQGGYSYPSGHAMISVAIYGFLIYYVYYNIRNKYLKGVLITLLVLLILGIGISRVYVGVHYPSDIIAGYSLALAILIIVGDWCQKNVRGK